MCTVWQSCLTIRIWVSRLWNGQKSFVWRKAFFLCLRCMKIRKYCMIQQKKVKPSGVIVALSGVEGLNASEKLRSLCPDSGLIWCSDLDFSLQAYRLRVKYFIKAPMTNEELCEGLSLLLKQRATNPKYKIQKKLNL